MTDSNPPINEIQQGTEVQLNPKQKLIYAFLDQYAATFETLSLDVPDDDKLLADYFSKLDTAPFLSPQELANANITIYQKRSDDNDDIRTAKGDHPGVFVIVSVGNKVVQINAWGGLRDTSDTVNFRDSNSTNLKGGGHAARTNALIDEPFRVDVQTFINDGLQDGLKLVFSPTQAQVGFKFIDGKRVSGDEGRYVFTKKRAGLQQGPVASMLPRLTSELKSTVEPMLPLIQGNRNFDPLGE